MGITFTALCHRLVGRGAVNHGDCNEDMSWVAVDGQLLHRAPVSAFVPAVCRTCPISVPIVAYCDGGIIKKAIQDQVIGSLDPSSLITNLGACMLSCDSEMSV